MQGKTLTKRIVALILMLVMVAALFPLGLTANAEQVTVKPFYTLNWSVTDTVNGSVTEADCFDYIYYMPNSWINEAKLTDETTELSIYFECYEATDPKEIARKMKEDFQTHPEGTRFFNFKPVETVLKHYAKDAVDLTKGVALIAAWLRNFLAEYSAIGGELDGIAVDLEYGKASSFYIHSAQYDAGNKEIYNQIVANTVYQERIREKLVDRGFQFYENPDPASYPYRSEIWTMFRYEANGGIPEMRNIWDDAISELMAEYINEAVYAPLTEKYPDAIVSEYKKGDEYGWLKGMDKSGNISTGNSTKAGNASNYNMYDDDDQPDRYFFGYSSTDDGAIDKSQRTAYKYPSSFNAAVFADNPFNRTLWGINVHKRMLASTDTGLMNSWITYFNFGGKENTGYSNTPYYSEAILHIGLMDPQPFFGYILKGEVEKAGKNDPDPNVGNYAYNLNVVNELMTELTRVAGASDRKPIITPASWNGGYILSGMYAGGRNIWRLTPDTSKVSAEDFKVKDQAPTFCVDGLTITFPQGRIIEDSSITHVGTCGYWIETPEGVTPVVTSSADRYSKHPSFQETFEGYKAETFTSDSVLPDTYWTVDGSAAIQESSGNKALALSGSTTITNAKVPQNITAGDDYAKQQAWEVTFTLPSGGNYGTINLFQTTSNDGLRITGGKVYYYDRYDLYLLNSIASVSNGGTYTAKRTVDFTGSTYYNSYYIYDANGDLLGSAENKAMKSVTLPVSSISMSTSSTTNAVLIDDYKLYPLGVTAVFEAFDAKYGLELTADTLASAKTKDQAYRLSWMNASSQYKAFEIYNEETDECIETVLMAPGMDGVATAIVEASAENPITLAVREVDSTPPTDPDYDNGDFSWNTYAENLGVTCFVGGNGYAKLEDAIAAAKTGQTVVMLADTTMEAPATIDKAITIQGNGKTIAVSDSFAGDYAIGVAAGGELIWDEGLTVNAGAKTALYICGGKLTVQGGEIIGETGVEVSGGKLDVTGGNIAADGAAIMLNQDAAKLPVAVNVTGGTLTGEAAFYQCNTSGTPSENISATISGAAITGTVEAAEQHFVMMPDDDGYYLHGHTVVIDAAVAPTCTETGLTEGIYYSCCDEVISIQEPIPDLGGHSWVAATCYTAKHCSRCGEIDANDALRELMKAMVVYGDHAKTYFGD